MWTIAIARLARVGPYCSPKTRCSPDATGVWSSPLALMAISFQWWSRAIGPTPCRGGCVGAARSCGAASKRGPNASLILPENPPEQAGGHCPPYGSRSRDVKDGNGVGSGSRPIHHVAQVRRPSCRIFRRQELARATAVVTGVFWPVAVEEKPDL